LFAVKEHSNERIWRTVDYGEMKIAAGARLISRHNLQKAAPLSGYEKRKATT